MDNTFLKLIEEYNVEIPIIQRDYAQGREEKKDLRTAFIKDILEAIENNKKLELDFIYGPVNGNIFSPLDGQQRLTTLYLLHWYLAQKEGKTIEDLKKFRYKVRTATQEFCNALLDENKGGQITLGDSPKKEILDASWYFSIWDYDPSIQGMLNMLDTIHEDIKKKKCNDLYKKLEDNKSITFNLLITNTFGLEDEIYMRMNARGIPLTPFENFKAWLQGYVSEKKLLKDSKNWKKEKETSWFSKLDKEWTDLIWRKCSQDNDKEKLFDQYFLTFFKGMAQFSIANSIQDKDDNRKGWIQDLSDKNKIISLREYEDIKCFDKEILEDIFETLDYISKNKGSVILKGFYFEEENDVFTSFIDKQEYKDKILFYALIKYLKNHDWKIDNEDKNYNQYKRVVRNLVENTNISNENFINAIQSVNELAEKSNDFLENIVKGEINSFSKEQVKEEILKAELILKENIWLKTIIDIEDHALFNGEIAFLLLKLDEKEENLLNISENDYRDFKKNTELSKKLWYENGAVNFNSKQVQLLIRTLLCMGFPLHGETDLSNKRWSWKNLFRKKEFRKAILKLLSEIKEGSINESGLRDILENKIIRYQEYNNEHSDCRSYLIKQDILLHKPYIWSWREDKAEIREFRTARALYKRYFIFPERGEFYNSVKRILLEKDITNENNIVIIEEDGLWGKLLVKIKIKNVEINICLEKGAGNSLLTVGILDIDNKEIKLDIQAKLKEFYSEISLSWSCYRLEDNWEENKNNPEKYANELIEIYNKINEITL